MASTTKTKKGRGRPATVDIETAINVGVLFTPPSYAELRNLAKARKQTLSDVVRSLVAKEVQAINEAEATQNSAD